LNRKGFALVLVLVMTLMMTSVAGMLYTSSNTNMMLTTNIIRQSQAKFAAQSGINHYMALHPHSLDDDLRIEETSLTSKTTYTVEVFNLSQNSVLIVSTGFYKKNNKVLYTHPIRAVVSR
jgi:type II secretory pathway component PulK